MAYYRKKPVVIEAVLVADVLHAAEWQWDALPPWVVAAYENAEGGHLVFATDSVHITTLEGTMRAEKGDWIIRGVHGELYPCKPDIFDATYETAAEQEPA